MIFAGHCCVCGCEIMLPEELSAAASRSESISFFCAYGHSLHFSLEKKKDNPSEPLAGLDGENVVMFPK